MIIEQNSLLFDPAKRKRFFGSNIDLLTMDETLATVEKIIAGGIPTQHCVVNVAKLVNMRKNPELMEMVNSCALVNVDGQGIVLGARLLGTRVPERVTGIDIFMNLMRIADKAAYGVYFFGAKDHVVKQVVQKFSYQYPHMVVAGYRDGYYKPEEEKSIVESIRRSGADILVVAMGSPAKEYFMNRNLHELNVPFVMGVGGSFDIVAGVTQRAPVWAQKAGLEWFFRMMNEPRRMIARYMTSNLQFLGLLIKAKFLGKKRYDCS